MEPGPTCQDASRDARVRCWRAPLPDPPAGTTKATVTTMTTTVTTTHGDTSVSPRAPRILLYSDDVTVREQVRLAVGRRLGAGQPDIEWLEVATPAAVVASADAGGWDLLVLDGEADKAGGMGLCRQLKNEVYRCPPV